MNSSVTTPFLCLMSEALHKADKSLHAIGFNLDQEQFALACIEVGRLQEISESVANTCKLMHSILHQLEPRAK